MTYPSSMAYRDDRDALRIELEHARRDLQRALDAVDALRAAKLSLLAAMSERAPTAAVPWRSVSGGEPVRFVLHNNTEDLLELQWLSFEGQVRREGRVVPGGRRTIHAFAGYLYRLRDQESGEIRGQICVHSRMARLDAVSKETWSDRSCTGSESPVSE